jgi:hypothetical protein
LEERQKQINKDEASKVLPGITVGSIKSKFMGIFYQDVKPKASGDEKRSTQIESNPRLSTI